MRFFKVQLLLKQPEGCALPAIGTEWYDVATDIVSALNDAAKLLHDLSVISDPSLGAPIDKPDSIEICREWENPSGERVRLTVTAPLEEHLARLEAQEKAKIEE